MHQWPFNAVMYHLCKCFFYSVLLGFALLFYSYFQMDFMLLISYSGFISCILLSFVYVFETAWKVLCTEDTLNIWVILIIYEQPRRQMQCIPDLFHNSVLIKQNLLVFVHLFSIKSLPSASVVSVFLSPEGVCCKPGEVHADSFPESWNLLTPSALW